MSVIFDEWRPVEADGGSLVMHVFHEGRLAAMISLVSFEDGDLPFGLEWAHGPILIEDDRRFPHLDAVVEAIERRFSERRNEPATVKVDRRQHRRRVRDHDQNQADPKFPVKDDDPA